MSVVIRLSRTGKKGERKFRVVVKEKRSKRDGKAIDVLGWVEKKESNLTQNFDKSKYEAWVAKGATPTPAVKKLIES